MPHDVALLGTFDTKSAELDALSRYLLAQGLRIFPVDLSLQSQTRVFSGEEKLLRMAAVSEAAARSMQGRPISAVVALGGGTGSEISLEAMRDLPVSLPKFLITTLPFDPRHALAANGTVLIPTLCDLQGMNMALRETFARAAAMVGACVNHPTSEPTSDDLAIGLSLLGVTQKACDEILPRLAAQGLEAMAFHANGFGGAALSRFAKEGRLSGMIDLTVNEIVRMHVKGAHVKMPERFTCAAHLPRLVMPGAINFYDGGPVDTIPEAVLKRPHYRHSSYFTHIKLTPEELEIATNALADDLNKSRAPCDVIIPMGGFSSEDRKGGAIEDEALRALVADILRQRAQRYTVTMIPTHIGDAETAETAVSTLLRHLP
ncbi:Tm-1-like ATP-binding domain-containing protein [Oceaniglobus ichthyenteri]|uniref:Tm-1-like ATP-binding domain-containing protein n=1 Tax=Oceaniglobus ichthyenteri TaxID=2136177 RepID=UPI000D3D4885|nr:Tm-1-like ATP-binding domain-containing protein [Oceaniglobus ichthyenteri]